VCSAELLRYEVKNVVPDPALKLFTVAEAVEEKLLAELEVNSNSSNLGTAH
jgi:hypothetical protein